MSESIGFERAYAFRSAMGLIATRELRIPTREERILQAKLLLEETLETIEKGLGLTVCDPYGDGGFSISYVGAKYDPVETLDGVSDVKVIANGIAANFGLPVVVADAEVFRSNMSKLDENGQPIINVCLDSARGDKAHNCADGACRLVDPRQPVGKILKSKNYSPARIAEILEASCPGHVASSHDSKICGRCGTSVESMR